jgi:hypothetical protein
MIVVTIHNDGGVLFRVLANDEQEVRQLQDAALRADLFLTTNRRFSTAAEVLATLKDMEVEL